MATTHSPDGKRREAPISELVRSLISDTVLLVRREAEFAKLELKAKASQVGVAAALMATGVVIGLYAVATLVAAAVLALALVLPAWAAASIVGVVLIGVAVALVMVGRSKVRAATPLGPTRTADAVKEDIEWIRTETDRLKVADLKATDLTTSE